MDCETSQLPEASYVQPGKRVISDLRPPGKPMKVTGEPVTIHLFYRVNDTCSRAHSACHLLFASSS